MTKYFFLKKIKEENSNLGYASIVSFLKYSKKEKKLKQTTIILFEFEFMRLI